MTLKDIAKQLTTAVQTVPNLVQILRDGLEEATAGSTVEVTQVVSSGTKIASVTVDDESTDLYAPDASVVSAETKICTFLGNDLYRQVIALGTITLSPNQEATITTIAQGLIPRLILATGCEHGIWYQIPDPDVRIIYNSESGDIKITVFSNWAITDGYLIIEYEKAAE